jgi:DnaJ like chaperone protein
MELVRGMLRQNFGDDAARQGDEIMRELFREQDMTPAEIFRKCEKVVNQLIMDGKLSYAGFSLNRLLDALDGWEETELEIIEG